MGEGGRRGKGRKCLQPRALKNELLIVESSRSFVTFPKFINLKGIFLCPKVAVIKSTSSHDNQFLNDMSVSFFCLSLVQLQSYPGTDCQIFTLKQ